MEYDKELDACGLNCPLPILKAKRALSTMESGTVLKVMSTDPGSPIHFATFIKQTGHQMVTTIDTEYGNDFYIRRK